MNLIQKYKISEDEVLKSINFLKKSDVVYAASVPTYFFLEHLENKNFSIIEDKGDNLTILNSNFTLKNGDIIFCNTDFVGDLFKTLKKFPKLQNLVLITAQSDLKVTKRTYNLKPKSINKWFCVNSTIVRDDLLPIPFGIANSSYEKNLVYEDFNEFKSKNEKKVNMIYGNFNLNTNYFHRIKAKKFLQNEENAIFEAEINFQEYIDSLHKYKFILCPWGNGIDTHRYWETVYAGAVPVTISNAAYESMKIFPGYLLKSYDKKNINEILKTKHTEVKFDSQMLKVSWWFNNLIYSDSLSSSEYSENISYSNSQIENLVKKFVFKKLLGKLIKKFKTLARKLHNKFLS